MDIERIEMNGFKHDIYFFHFDTNAHCEEFVNILHATTIRITHVCCGGLGFGVNNADKLATTSVYETFMQAKKDTIDDDDATDDDDAAIGQTDRYIDTVQSCPRPIFESSR